MPQIFMPPQVPGWTPSVILNRTVTTASAPITNNAGTAPRINACLMRIEVPPEGVGTVVQLASSVEVSVGMSYSTLVGGFLRITRDGQFINPADPMDIVGIPARPMGWNIQHPGSHYRIDHKFMTFVVPDTSVYYLCHVVYGASTSYAGNPADRLVVQYVEQVATVWTPRPGTWVDAPPDDPRFADLLARVEALEGQAP